MARPNPGKPPSAKARVGPRLVECPQANDSHPPQPPVYIPQGVAKAAGSIRGEGEQALAGRMAARQKAAGRTPLVDARLASYSSLSTPSPSVGETGPLIPNLVRITDTRASPYRQVCFLEITPAGGDPLQGSGWLAAPNLVITAGHCVFQQQFKRWANTIRVHLAVDGSDEPYDTQDSHNRL